MSNQDVRLLDSKGKDDPTTFLQGILSMHPNVVFFGETGSGHGTHPWDGLNSCKCGGFPFMEGKDGVFETGAPYRVVCTCCGSKTEQGDVATIRDRWNEKNENIVLSDPEGVYLGVDVTRTRTPITLLKYPIPACPEI